MYISPPAHTTTPTSLPVPRPKPLQPPSATRELTAVLCGRRKRTALGCEKARRPGLPREPAIQPGDSQPRRHRRPLPPPHPAPRRWLPQPGPTGLLPLSSPLLGALRGAARILPATSSRERAGLPGRAILSGCSPAHLPPPFWPGGRGEGTGETHTHARTGTRTHTDRQTHSCTQPRPPPAQLRYLLSCACIPRAPPTDSAAPCLLRARAAVRQKPRTAPLCTARLGSAPLPLPHPPPGAEGHCPRIRPTLTQSLPGLPGGGGRAEVLRAPPPTTRQQDWESSRARAAASARRGWARPALRTCAAPALAYLRPGAECATAEGRRPRRSDSYAGAWAHRCRGPRLKGTRECCSTGATATVGPRRPLSPGKAGPVTGSATGSRLSSCQPWPAREPPFGCPCRGTFADFAARTTSARPAFLQHVFGNPFPGSNNRAGTRRNLRISSEKKKGGSSSNGVKINVFVPVLPTY